MSSALQPFAQSTSKKASRNGLNNNYYIKDFRSISICVLAHLQLNLNCGVICQVRFHSRVTESIINKCCNLFIQSQV